MTDDDLLDKILGKVESSEDPLRDPKSDFKLAKLQESGLLEMQSESYKQGEWFLYPSDPKIQTRVIKNFSQEFQKAREEAKEELAKRIGKVQELERRINELNAEGAPLQKKIPRQEFPDPYGLASAFWEIEHGSQEPFDLEKAQQDIGTIRQKLTSIAEKRVKLEGEYYDVYEQKIISALVANGLSVQAFTQKEVPWIYSPAILDAGGRARAVCVFCGRESIFYLAGPLLKNPGVDVLAADCNNCGKLVSFMLYGSESKRNWERSPRRVEPDPKLVQKGSEVGAYRFMRGEWEARPAMSMFEQGYNRVMLTQKDGDEKTE